MTIEEKLTHFYDTSVEEARRQAEKDVREHKEALDAFKLLCRTEGIIPALESSHALAGAMRIAAEMEKDKIVLVNLSGRGDKDMETIAAIGI